jgi:hypothetical protein
MQRVLNLSDICWHDGVLSEVRILPQEKGSPYGDVTINVALYPLNEAGTNPDWSKHRAQRQLVFKNVVSLTQEFHFAEINDNSDAGNIDRADLVDDGEKYKTLNLRLLGGNISVTFSWAEILE